MLEKEKIATSSREGRETRNAIFFIKSELTCISGNWYWDMLCDNIFCSDVMAALPENFEGTKSIIHPEDLAAVIERLGEFNQDRIPYLEFRVITSYGEVKTITGEDVILSDQLPIANLNKEVVQGQNVVYDLQRKKEAEKLDLKTELFEYAELVADTGSWFHNSSLNETWYSDNVYRIFGIPPQSLNAHPHTFTHLIHADDAQAAEEGIDRCFREKLPLSIEYRIQCVGGSECYIQHTLHWRFNSKGESVLFGVIRDNTHQKNVEDNYNQSEDRLAYEKELLHFNEMAVESANWQINLITRQVFYSDNCFRIHGIKRNAVPNNLHSFINFVHSDDREKVLESIRKIFSHHALPELEYRIVTKEGKVKHIQQKARLLVYGGSEMMMAGNIRDVSNVKFADRKAARVLNQHLLNEFATARIQEVTGIGSWLWNLEKDEITWSESMFALVDMKPVSMQFRESLLLNIILPEDKKTYTDAVRIAAKEHLDTAFHMRILRKGEVRHLKAIFKIVTYSKKHYFIGTLQDVTHEIKMAHELQDRINVAESLTENIADGILISDLSNNIILWNKRCEEIFRKAQDEVIGKNLFEVSPHFKNENDFNQLAKALKGETIHAPARSTNFGKRLHELTLMPLLNNENEVWAILHVLHDVTKEVILREELVSRLQFIEKLLETSVDQVIVLDKNLKFQYWNKAAEDHYDLKKENVIGKTVFEVFPSVIHDPYYPEYKKVLKGETIHIPAPLNARQYHKKYTETFLIPLKNDLNQVTHMLSIVHDLSIEYELAEQQRKAEEIFNTINEAFVELDAKGNIKYINRKGAELWNVKQNHLDEYTLWDIFPEVEEPGLRKAINSSLYERTSARDEFYSTTLQKWYAISTTPSDEGVVALFSDVTNEKAMREKLEKDHEIMKQAQAIARVGSFKWDVITNEVYCSDELFRMYGLEPQSEVITLKRMMSFIHPADACFVNNKIEDHLKVPGKMELQHRIVLASGEVKHVYTQVEYFANSQGIITHATGNVSDISERCDVEEKVSSA